MSRYTDAMEELAAYTVDAYLCAIKATAEADSQDGAPVDEIRKIKIKLDDIAKDVESLLDTRMTVQQAKDAESLYKGANLAGLAR
jgi:hypothetical protein